MFASIFYNINGWICSLSRAISIDFIIYLGEEDNAVGLVIQLVCAKGTKKIFLLFNNFPILSAFVLSPSFVTIPSNIGLLFLKRILAEFRIGVSYIAVASFDIVFPWTRRNY